MKGREGLIALFSDGLVFVRGSQGAGAASEQAATCDEILRLLAR